MECQPTGFNPSSASVIEYTDPKSNSNNTDSLPPLLSLPNDSIVKVFKNLNSLDKLMALSITCKKLYQLMQPMLSQNPQVLSQAITRALQNNKLSNFFLRFPKPWTAPIPISQVLGTINSKISFNNFKKLLEQFPNATGLERSYVQIVLENPLEKQLRKTQIEQAISHFNQRYRRIL